MWNVRHLPLVVLLQGLGDPVRVYADAGPGRLR